jgi:single stranded DNA-binding protein
MLGGAAPIPASSGQTIRVRLNRSGDRQLNQALYTVVLTRLRTDPVTRAYAQRRRAQGKTNREVKRCLVRYVARQLYRLLESQPALDGFTNTGTAVANLRVAVTQRIQQDGQWRDGDTSFFKVNVWRGQAEHLADSLGKGDRVMVTGRLRQRSWETPEGEKRSVAEIEADEVGASLKFATAKVERASDRGPSDRSQGQERQAERGGDFNEGPPF